MSGLRDVNNDRTGEAYVGRTEKTPAEFAAEALQKAGLLSKTKQADAVQRPKTEKKEGTSQAKTNFLETFKATFKLPPALQNINLTSTGSTILKELGKLFGPKEGKPKYTEAQVNELGKLSGPKEEKPKYTEAQVKAKALEIARQDKNVGVEQLKNYIKNDKEFVGILISMLEKCYSSEDVEFLKAMNELEGLSDEAKPAKELEIYKEFFVSDKLNLPVDGAVGRQLERAFLKVKSEPDNFESNLSEALKLAINHAYTNTWKNLDYNLAGTKGT